MSKKHRIITAAGAAALLLLLLVGLSIVQSRQNSLPSFAFASDRSGAGDIFVADSSGQIRNLTNNPAADWNPVWSPDGKTLAFTSHRSGNSDIWLLDVTQPDQPARNLTNDPAWDYSPTWSPSGQSVAFISERDGDAEVFVQNINEDKALQLTFNHEMERQPAWSPDGKYIAFAAVRNGVEEIYRIRPDGTDEQLLTPHPIQGTSPTWSPTSQRLAFIGWDDQNRAGIYIIGPKLENLTRLYQSDTWLGSLRWSADDRWFTFTAWQNGNHDLYALPITGGDPVRVTTDPAWDDFLTLNPRVPFDPSPTTNIAQAAPAAKPAHSLTPAAGVNMADLSLAYLVNDLGFTWAKGYVNWGTVEPERGQLRWVDPDNIVKAYGDQQLKILMRVHGSPTWTRPADSLYSRPPDQLADFANFMTALATRYKGQVAAYEIWNEPNLDYEWGYVKPDPAAYTAMLKTAYSAVKKADPNALVISGGLATTGDGSATAYGDLAFLQGMYNAGAKGYFDAFGSHPYAYGHNPDDVNPDGLSLSRVVEQHRVMQANGDGNTPIWITETGWVLQTNWDLGEHTASGVTEAQQADYVARAYAKAGREWPFVQAIFLFNLDFSIAPWYPAAEPMRWYAILNPDRTPRPAYTILRQAVHAP